MAATLSAAQKLTRLSTHRPTHQQTLHQPIAFSGIGLFTGEEASLTLCPSDENTGIVFQRVDLEGAPKIRAHLDQVVSTPRCTILGDGSFTIQTVEHVLAALSGLGVDNALLKLDGPEVPILDGSSEPFVSAILEGGIAAQDKERNVASLQNPVYWSQDEVHLVALPADEFRISYTLHYPESTLLRSQFLSMCLSPADFASEIAPSRTFCFYEEIAPLIEIGMIKGGGLDNAVIIKNDVVLNEGGARFADEMVRHKILDLLGDLSLLPMGLMAHIIAIRSGHSSNIAFGKKLLQQLMMESM